MAAKRVVHIVGTGTIGEPLIGLFLNLRDQLELDEITSTRIAPCSVIAPKSKILSGAGPNSWWRQRP